MNPNDTQSIFDFLLEVRKLQHVNRFTPQPDGTVENDAEHSWAVAMTCMTMASRLEKEFNIKIDQAKMLKMALIHDLGEIETGDTQTWDVKSRINKEENERTAMHNLVEQLPKDLGDELLSLWEECEKKETLEAQIVKSIDRLDPVLHRTAFMIGWQGSVAPDQATLESLNARQLPRHQFSETLTKLFETIRDEAVKRGLFNV